MSIARDEWMQMTLMERLIEHYVRIPDAVDMNFLADDLKEAMRSINTLRQLNFKAEAENRRLKQLLHEKTP
jgi:hypothetical protein